MNDRPTEIEARMKETLRKGKTALKAGCADITENCFRCVIGLLPKEAQAWHALGSALSTLERFEEAAEAFQESARMDCKNPEPVGARTTVLLRAWKRDC